MTMEDIVMFRDRLRIPIPDSQLDAKLPPYFRPAENSEENQYLIERRLALGGSPPAVGQFLSPCRNHLTRFTTRSNVVQVVKK